MLNTKIIFTAVTLAMTSTISLNASGVLNEDEAIKAFDNTKAEMIGVNPNFNWPEYLKGEGTNLERSLAPMLAAEAKNLLEAEKAKKKNNN